MKQKWVTQIEEEKKNHGGRRWWFGAVIIFLSPWIVGGVGLGIVIGGMACAGKALSERSWRWALRCSTVAGQVSAVMTPLSPLAFGYPVENFLATTAALAETLYQANQTIELALPYLLVLTNSGAPFPPAETTQLSQAVTLLSERLAYLQSQLLDSSQYWPSLRTFLPRVESGRRLAAKIDLLVGELPQLLSLGGQSRWLVLLQDDTELRPTGGFIDGLGLVRVDNGRIAEPRWLVATAADAQLTGQVSPPVELTQALGETSWYLRDSNWDPDFPTSAARAAWFVSRELNQTVDMVVAVNLAWWGEILRVVGPVDLPQFGGQITADNWRDHYLQSVKLDDPQRFLPLLAEGVWSKIPSLSSHQLVALLPLLVSGLETDQIQLWPQSPSAAVTLAGWDGRVGPTSCNSPFPCLNDFIYIVDANVGVNKVDSALGRSLAVTGQIGPQQVETTYRLVYTNLAPVASWPLGEWRSYTRLYLPLTAEILRVRWGGEELSGDRLFRSNEKGMQKLALSIQVPVGENRELEIAWRQTIPTHPRWHYQLSLAHQSGVAPFPAQIVISYPPTWWSQAGPSPDLATPGEFRYNSTIDRSLRFNVDWVPSL